DTLPTETCQRLGEDLLVWRQHINIHPNQYGILSHNIFAQRPIFKKVLSQFKLQQKAEQIYGGPLLFFQDNLIWKPPGTTTSISWHQDYSYWPLSQPKGITMWIAIDDINSLNGCMMMGIGSHHQGECIPNDFVENKPAQWAQNLPSLRITNDMIHPLKLPQGSICVHHPLCAHTSGENRSKTQRRAWSITFVDPHVRWSPKHAPHPYNYNFGVQEEEDINNLPLHLSKWNNERYNTHIPPHEKQE
ncbi:MAG: hypothetical protein CL916_11130, partial [Deltaproteobacteria bacterium]|nr:hypothetical protein [Deltaproteobacteria bacterium]